MFLVSIDRSEVSTYTKRVHLLLKFRFSCRIFSIFTSRRCEFTLGVELGYYSCYSPVSGAYHGAHANVSLAEKF
jgi:hypothetical protein